MDQVEEIKNKIDIVELIKEYVPLKRAGRNFKGLCPFHGEKTPSFMVNPELQIYKCFGCGQGGDTYAFLQAIEGMEFGEALQNLAKRAGITLVSYRPSQTEELKEKQIQLNTMAGDVYHFVLTKHRLGKPALAYIKGRGVTDETLAKFKLGYAPAKWDVLTKFLTGKKKFSTSDVERAGLAIPGKGYDRFRDRLMFPIINHRSQVVGFTGRQLPWSKEMGGKYVNSPDGEIFHKSEILYGLDKARSEIKSAGFAVLVEGQMDVLPSWQAGVKNIVAASGTALTSRQVELLRRITDTVVMALDTDFAGDAAARRGIEIAETAGLIIKVVASSEKYKDPGEWAAADAEGWQKAVAEAMPIYDFYLQSAVKRFGIDVVGKKKITRELLPIWAKIDDEIVKAHYILKLAQTLGVGEADVRAQLAKLSQPAVSQSVQPPVAEPESRRELIEGYLVELALKGERVGDLVKVTLATPFWQKVVEVLVKEPDVKKLPAEMKERVQALFLTENEYGEREWQKTLDRLELVDISEKLTLAPDPAESVKLGRRKAELTKSL
ncbi:MAG: DNA primase [bacterium]|nr:DNA primase [bacterium]